MKKCHCLLLTLIGCGWLTVAQANVPETIRPAKAYAISDTVALAGKAFDRRVTALEAFGSNYDTYSIDASTPLPPGLSFSFSQDTLIFSGVPNISGLDSNPNFITVIGETAGTQESTSFTITVQSAPVFDPDASEPGRIYSTELEEKGPDSVAVTNTDAIITDQDGAVISKVVISLGEFELYDNDEEYLHITEEGQEAAKNAGITGLEYNGNSGNIELIGEATLEEYQAVLREILYVNTSEALEAGQRIIVFSLTDVDGNASNPSFTLVDIIPENDPPIIDINGEDESNSTDGSPDFINNFTEDQPLPAVVTDTDVVMEDVDFDSIGQFTVSILNRLDDTPIKQHESLEIIGMLPAGFSFGYDINQQDLIITGEGSLEDFATAIEQVGYYNTDQDPDNTPRRISIIFSDLAGGTDQAFAQINVIPVNDPPDAMDSTIYVAEGRQGNRMKLDYPTDIDNSWDELTITVSGLPTLGTVTRADGTPVAVGETLDSLAFAELRYDSPDNYDNSDPGDFTYTTTDLEPQQLSTLSTINIIINNAPEAADTTIVTDEDIAYILLDTLFSENYTDVEGDTLTSIIITTLPNNSTLMLDTVRLQAGDTIGINAFDSLELRFIPAADMFGNPFTTFNFQVIDAVGLASDPYQVTVIVNPVNDPPVVDTVLVAGEENDILFFTADQFISQFSDIDGDTLVNINIVSLPANGILLLDGEPVALGDTIPVEKISQLAFEPETNFDGVTEFLWNGYDGTAYAEQPAPVIITISENNLLRARDSEELVDEDMLFLESSLVPNVINPTGHPIIFDTAPIANVQHGILILNADGTYRYTPDEGFVGEDAFTFRVCNQDEPGRQSAPECAEATVTITVRRRSSIVIFKGFSPDGDGRNDVWRIPNIEEYPNNTVQIFNRWGNRVFEATGYNNADKAWGGTGLTKSNVPDGTYYYLIDLGPEGLQEKPLSGYLIVNR